MLDKRAAEAKLIDESYEDSLVGSTVLGMVCNLHESWIWLGRQKPQSGRPQEFGNNDLQTFWMLTPFSIGIGWKTWYWLLKSCKILVKYEKDSRSREMSSTWIVRVKHWITSRHLHFTSCQIRKIFFLRNFVIGEEKEFHFNNLFFNLQCQSFLKKHCCSVFNEIWQEYCINNYWWSYYCWTLQFEYCSWKKKNSLADRKTWKLMLFDNAFLQVAPFHKKRKKNGVGWEFPLHKAHSPDLAQWDY